MAVPQNPALESARLQTARGLACLLLVAYHVIGPNGQSGMRIPDDSLWRYFTLLFHPIRMPLFTFLSGFVYAYKPVTREGWSQFATGKLGRLGIPLIVATTVTFLLLAAVAELTITPTSPGEVPDFSQMWRAYVYPFRHLWFLQALLGILAVVIVLELTGWLRTMPRFAAVFAVSLVVLGVSPGGGIELFSFSNVTYLLAFFLLGIAANRFRDIVFARSVRLGVVALFVGAFAIHALSAWEGYLLVANRRSLMAITVGMTAALCTVQWLPPLRPLQWLGSYSFSIYLYHLALLSVVAMGADRWGITSLPFLFTLGMLGGILIPIALEHGARRSSWASLLLLGETRSHGSRRRDREVAVMASATRVK